MSKTESLNSPAELVAIARAAHVVGDVDLKRAAVGALVTRFGIRIRFPKPDPNKGVADGGPLPLTMTDAEIGRELRLSAKTIRRMNDAATIPQPVTVGARSLRWVRQTIVEWLAAGCPDRTTFEETQKGGR